jgi:DNA-binding winged helix-turn-helix (wHTH) protein/Tfp pilus assembly protein PilF
LETRPSRLIPLYRFGPFVADRTAYRVLEGDRVLELTPKLLDLLFHLLDRPATLVTREALLDAVWPGANVTDNAVAQAISELRDALDDDPSAPRYIRTVARRGYRFVANVARETAPTADANPGAPRIGGPVAIAVLDFANVAGDPEIAWLGRGIAETVTNDLAARSTMRVVDRWRVVDALHRTDGTLSQMAAALDVGRVVTGSYQRNGPALRITARIVDLQIGETIADAKVDGLVEDAFALQDQIVAGFMGETASPGPHTPYRLGVRETSSLDAYRAVMEGGLKIESLDTAQIHASIADFERAIAIDPQYAIAYAGLANAELVSYEATKLTPAPDVGALSSGIEHAGLAVRLDARLAEAQGTLAFLFTSAGRFDEARAAARRAVALEPENWRHHYRLGHAEWGNTRLRALGRTLELYPRFGFASLEMAFVHVARGDLAAAERVVRIGLEGQRRFESTTARFPALGFHWLLGLLLAAREDNDAADAGFDQEIAQANPNRLYGPEYAAAALVGRGHTALARGMHQSAVQTFERAFTFVTDLPQAHLGLAVAFGKIRNDAAAATARQAARHGIAILRSTDRPVEAALLEACDLASDARPDAALQKLGEICDAHPPGFPGWTVPVEPLLRPLHGSRGFAEILEKLARRAR